MPCLRSSPVLWTAELAAAPYRWTVSDRDPVYPVIGAVAEAGYEPEPPPRLKPWLLGGLVIIGLMAFLGFGADSIPTDDDEVASDPTLPPAPLFEVPDVTGSHIARVDELLATAGIALDGFDAGWVASEARPPGIVLSQDPPAGTLIEAGDAVRIIVSAGGPIVGVADLSSAVQALVRTDGRFDPAEPIGIKETAAGPAYKQDALLFGGCGAVAAARTTYHDTDFQEACVELSSSVLTGWLPDGGGFRITGLPSGEYHPVEAAGTIGLVTDDGTVIPLGLTGWTRLPTVAASVEVAVSSDRFIVRRGFWEVVTRADPAVLAAIADVYVDLALRTEPHIIDGHLILQLPRPLAFVGATTGQHVTALNYGQFFVSSGCPDSPAVLCDPTGRVSLTSQGRLDLTGATITFLGDGWRTLGRDLIVSVPDSWVVGGSLTPATGGSGTEFSAGTFELPIGGEVCPHLPVNALRAMGSDDVLLTVRAEPAEDERPRFFSEDAFIEASVDAIECAERPDLEIFTGEFDGALVLVAFGPEATDQTRARAWAILDSLESND